ncbi:holo-ACP synthase [Pelagibacterales bacterium SAG-MED39]|nr:holo-ACP synthase [Pelagibacterales bacterium SAG-MED39]
MKILGVGVDITKNQRFNKLIKNKKFLKKTFGKNEIIFSKKTVYKTCFFAKRFAAKESLSKSLGTGFRNDLHFKDVEVLNDKMGKPYFVKTKKINDIIKKRFNVKKYDLFLSISDEKDYSVAFTILQAF